MSKNKLDGVGPVDNRPSTDKLHHFVKKNKKNMWHVTRDMWHVTCDTWHVVTRDMWHVTCYEDLEEKDEWINELMN